ncbi:MAG: hypothetical protein ACRDKG_14125 [Actinomycetota bacterium]
MLSACAAAPEAPSPRSVAKIDRIDAATARITLTDQTVARMGIETVPVSTTPEGLVVPYGALIYDVRGDAFVYTNPSPLVFVRHAVRVKQIRGDLLVLADGPASGVRIVTIGAGLLLGIELGIGER